MITINIHAETIKTIENILQNYPSLGTPEMVLQKAVAQMEDDLDKMENNISPFKFPKHVKLTDSFEGIESFEELQSPYWVPPLTPEELLQHEVEEMQNYEEFLADTRPQHNEFIQSCDEDDRYDAL